MAQTYLALRATDAERALMSETLAAYRDTLNLTRSRYEAGDVAELDVARASTEVASTEFPTRWPLTASGRRWNTRWPCWSAIRHHSSA